MKQLFVILLAVLFFIPACSWFEPEKEKTAEELADDGLKSFQDENYRQAIESFSDLRNWYPFSKYAATADLKIADSHYKLKEYDEAVAGYTEFENLHPRNEAVPEVIFKIGLCYFDQMDTIDRDQSNTLKAYNTFRRLTQQFPGDPFALKAEEHMATCLESLAAHELYVGKFYFKSKHFKAALGRFQTVVSSYPGTKALKEAEQYILKCEQHLNGNL